MKDVDNIINKSLEEIDELIGNLEKSNIGGDNDLIKSDEEPKPEEVSDDIPESADSEEDDGEEGADDGSEPTEEEDEIDEDEEEMEKSLESELKSKEGVKQALEVSEFLQEFVKSISNVIGDLEKSIKSNDTDITKSLGGSNELLAKSLNGIVKSNKAILESHVRLSKSMNEITSRLESIETQPMVRKSVSNAKAIDKSFDTSLGMQETTNTNKLSKSQAVAQLTKSYEGGNGDLLNDILALESTGDFGTLSESAKLELGIK